MISLRNDIMSRSLPTLLSLFTAACTCVFTRLSSCKEGGTISSQDPTDDSGSVTNSNGKYFHLKNIEIASVSNDW